MDQDKVEEKRCQGSDEYCRATEMYGYVATVTTLGTATVLGTVAGAAFGAGAGIASAVAIHGGLLGGASGLAAGVTSAGAMDYVAASHQRRTFTRKPRRQAMATSDNFTEVNSLPVRISRMIWRSSRRWFSPLRE